MILRLVTSARNQNTGKRRAYAFGHSTNYGNGAFGGLTVDGSFGAHTNAATRNFQSCVHLHLDGIIGPDTWSQLNFWVNHSGFACA